MNSEMDVVIVDGARTPVGTFGGAFRSTPAYQLGSIAIREALSRASVDATEVDEVVLGCVGQVGPEAFNARRASLEAGIPASSNAYNVNRLCGSGLQSVWAAANSIRLGESRVVVAGGNENMTMQPFLDYGARAGYRLGNRVAVDGTLSLVTDPWGNYPMGVTAENVAKKFDVSRAAQDEFALASQLKAAAAQEDGVFASELIPVTVREGKTDRVVDADEHLRPDSSLERLAQLKPAFDPEGTVTAGNSSGINDGAAALVIMNEGEASRRGLRSRARLVGFAKSGIEPGLMGYAPVRAIERVLEQAALGIREVDIVEINEAFAAQAVAVARGVGLDPGSINPFGGAIAIGHPVGATGTMLLLRTVYALERLDKKYGLISMCIGGGQAIAVLIQRT